MAVEDFLHMKAGDGESSYSNNSMIQKSIAQNSLRVVKNTMKHMYEHMKTFPDCMKIADLGCSSGDNTLLIMYEIINFVHGLCKEKNRNLPDFQVFLNDLPMNDFNSIFQSTLLADLLRKLHINNSHCFISGTPGSFYTRLFPKESLNFVHSSTSLHWLSQVPNGLNNNKGKIYIGKTSPPNVFEAYLKQFQKDFTMFLSLRSEEIVHNGKMVLTFFSRGTPRTDPITTESIIVWDSIAASLMDMVHEGLVEEAKVDSFNLPMYAPHKDEVEDIIQREGSFNSDVVEVMEISDGLEDNGGDIYTKGENVANTMRAVLEPLLESHFGKNLNMDDLFKRFANYIAMYVSVEKLKYVSIVISLTKK